MFLDKLISNLDSNNSLNVDEVSMFSQITIMNKNDLRIWKHPNLYKIFKNIDNRFFPLSVCAWDIILSAIYHNDISKNAIAQICTMIGQWDVSNVQILFLEPAKIFLKQIIDHHKLDSELLDMETELNKSLSDDRNNVEHIIENITTLNEQKKKTVLQNKKRGKFHCSSVV